MGPLSGIKVIEVAGIGPAPFCGMLLSDMGAEVVLIERKAAPLMGFAERSGEAGKRSIVHRGKKSLAMDLKKPAAAAALLRLVADADLLIEGFRPGVMEKLGLGPAECTAVNRRLVYGRMTGWGQHGPLSHCAGHDINYIALAGALYHGGHRESPPAAPPTLVGDVGGGAMLLAVGLLAALLEARQSGEGQVIDAAVSDGAALMTSLLLGLQQQGFWTDQRQANMLDGGSHWYDCYECADGGYVSVGALEPSFYRQLLEKCGLSEDAGLRSQFEPSKWPSQKQRMTELFKSRTRDEWCEILEGTDACFAPVLNMSEAPRHPHNMARRTFVEIDGVTQAAPAPRFSRTPGRIRGAAPASGEHSQAVLHGAGFSEQEIARLRAQDVI
ncbi:MAG TPA: CaiB/BaiF CoA-transferase family protein [Woeseiaceae bacterium]|nr:CaiB/BaiF CoA-transferase family protein [Woeseiaceae bacterium]